MNIELHGSLPEQAKMISLSIWSKLLAKLPKRDFEECIVTTVNVETMDHNGRSAPFFRIYSDRKSDFVLAIKILKQIRMPGAGMKTVVECLPLAKCIEL